MNGRPAHVLPNATRPLFAAVLALALAACGGGAGGGPSSSAAGSQPLLASAIPAGKTVTIRFESYNFGTPGLGGKGTQSLIDEFQSAFPNIKVEGKYTAVEEIINSVGAEVAANQAPDVAQLATRNTEFAAQQLRAVALDQAVPRDEYQETMRHILPQARALGLVGDHHYGAPYTISTPTLFYNADLFKAAGLDPDQPPRTWAEVRQYGQQIKDRTGKAAVYIGEAIPTNVWLIQSLISSNGGAILSADRSQAAFNQPAAVDTLTQWQAMVQAGIHPSISSNDATAAFNNGNLAMYLTSTALLSAAEQAARGKFDLRTAGEPSFDGNTVRPVNSGSSLFMFAKDPVQQRAAWEFMKFVSSQRGFTIITSQIGYLPLRDDVLDDPNYLKPYIDNNPRILPPMKQLDTLEPGLNWPGKNAVQATQLFADAIGTVVYGGADPQRSMDATAARVAELLRAD